MLCNVWKSGQHYEERFKWRVHLNIKAIVSFKCWWMDVFEWGEERSAQGDESGRRRQKHLRQMSSWLLIRVVMCGNGTDGCAYIDNVAKRVKNPPATAPGHRAISITNATSTRHLYIKPTNVHSTFTAGELDLGDWSPSLAHKHVFTLSALWWGKFSEFSIFLESGREMLLFDMRHLILSWRFCLENFFSHFLYVKNLGNVYSDFLLLLQVFFN